MSLQQLFTSRKPYTASTFVAGKGKLFYNELTGELRLGDGSTAGGLPVPVTLATTSTAGSVKIGPGVVLNNDGQIIIDSTGLDFSFGDFQATVAGSGAATLSSINTDQNIDIVSNGEGVINVVGDFHIHRTVDYDPNNFDVDGAVFAVKADGQIQMKVPLSDVTTGALEIIGNDTGLFLPPNQTGVILHVTGNSGLVSRNYFDANANYVLLAGRRYNGTQLAPTRVLANEIMLRLVAQGTASATSTGTAAFQTFGPARISFIANEDQTPTAQGGRIAFEVTKNGFAADGVGTNTITAAYIDAQNGLTAIKFVGPLTGNVTGTATTATYAQSFNTGTLVTLAVSAVSATTAGTVTTAAQPAITSVGTLTNLAIATGGTITTPRVIINDGGIRTISGGTTCTIDFATDSIILWTAPSGTAAITLSNYTAGAQVKLIIALTTTRDITYGISSVALSSTGADNWNGAGAGSVDIANTAVHLEYTCFTALAAGCYVKVTVN